MDKRFLALILFIVSCAGLTASAQQTATYFPYPIVPDSISTLQARTDYLLEHFWDFCDFKKAFSSRQKMAGAFKDYLSFMPHASARQAHRSVAKLLKSLDKQPDDLLFLARKAEEYIHSDTSDIYSDELYLPFAVAVSSNKRIEKAIRDRYTLQARILSGSQTGMPAPSFAYTDRSGVNAIFSPDSTAEVTILFFNDPDCMDCTIARSRLNADIRASNFIKEGVMRVVAITPGEADENWKQMAESYPESWIVGASSEVDEIYDIPTTPTFYVIDDEHKIALKRIDINTLLNLISRL
ncbi:MAG: DUF5106 domain-containing protein [Bacteroides sp.]|nr:DUF5106 domain-containing protein [Barnesiella sp.]MBD5324246.1 DUF5106 domain-containing protein [Bacteroides sp.]